MKRLIPLLLLLLAIGCRKKSDSPPPPPDTANVSGTWSGPYTYTYPVIGGPVTSVTVNANLSLTLKQDGLGVSGTYADSTGSAGNVSGTVQNHTFTGSLDLTPVGIHTAMNVIAGTGMKLQIINTPGVTGSATLAHSSSSSDTGIGGF